MKIKLVKESLNDELIVFRGQTLSFYDSNVRTGYNDPKGYNMLFVHPDINVAYSCTSLPGNLGYYDNFYREIVVFSIPNNIKKLKGVVLDRISSSKPEIWKEEGYIGMTSDIGEFHSDAGEIALFYMPEPIERFQTRKGFFSKTDLNTMIDKYGLDAKNALRNEKDIKDRLSHYPKDYYKTRHEVKW